MVCPALHLLGPPRLTLPHGDPALDLAATKSLALLAYLALEPGAHSRDELATLLWGDSSGPAARTSLRQALRRLRRVLGDVLRIDRNAVALAGPLDCDVVAFLEAARLRPREAAEFDVPQFLAGFTLRHAPVFEEWAEAKREGLRHRYVDVLRTLAHEATARSCWGEVVPWADRWLQCEPLADEAVRLAAEALYLGGDRDGAVARLVAHRERIRQELGTEPGATLLELTARVQAGRETATPRPAGEAREAPTPSFDARLVGREQPWQTLAGIWSAVADGSGRVVLMEGEAGVGKTRLGEEFLRWTQLRGATALRGRGYDPASGAPFGPVIEALRGALRAPGLAGAAPEWLTEVTRLLPELRQRFPALSEPAAPADPSGRGLLFEGVAQVILAIAAEQPTVLFIDDLQWCDAETCALLLFLTRRFEKSAVLLLLALTLGELERDAPAARLCRALRIQAHAMAVTLPPLTEEAEWFLIRELGHITRPDGARRFAQRVHEVTDGNPFYLMELLKTLFAQGILLVNEATGVWAVAPAVGADGYSQLPMPETVHDAIAERVRRLPYELRDLLAAVAVAGRGCRADLLAHVNGIGRLHAAALGDALVERRLLVADDGVYRCGHSVIAEVVRDSLSASRRHELHRAVALSLEAVTTPAEARELAGELARHASLGGEGPLAYRYALMASDAALERYAFDEALTWLDLAAAVAGDAGETEAVNRRTAAALRLAGWTEVSRPAPRQSAAGRRIERRDFDLEAPATTD